MNSSGYVRRNPVTADAGGAGSTTKMLAVLVFLRGASFGMLVTIVVGNAHLTISLAAQRLKPVLRPTPMRALSARSGIPATADAGVARSTTETLAALKVIARVLLSIILQRAMYGMLRKTVVGDAHLTSSMAVPRRPCASRTATPGFATALCACARTFHPGLLAARVIRIAVLPRFGMFWLPKSIVIWFIGSWK